MLGNRTQVSMREKLHRLSIPNPFFEGRNSVYVIKDDPVTLVDTGVATDKAYQHLVDGLRDVQLSVKDIERVVLTHKHIDHIGNAWRLQEEDGSPMSGQTQSAVGFRRPGSAIADP